MSTKAGRVTKKDVRQGKTMWIVNLSRLHAASNPVPVLITYITGGFLVCARMYSLRIDFECINLAIFSQAYIKSQSRPCEYFISRRAANRFIRLNAPDFKK